MKGKILVTGSKGQLGSEIQKLADPEIMSCSYYDVDTLDISDIHQLRAVFEKEQPAFIINCAAFTAVDKAEQEKELAYKVNQLAVKNIAQLAAEFNTKIIHVSTDYVFDGTKATPYNEEDLVNPQGVYGASKLAGEKELEGNPDAIIIRTSWLYSSFGNNFVKTILRYSRERGYLRVVYDQVGTPTYAADLAAAILTICELSLIRKEAFVPGIYHFSNEGVCSWYDFAKEICNMSNIHCTIDPIETVEYPLPAKRPAFSVFSKSKIKKIYNLQIPYWKDSLSDCLRILNNQ